MSDYSEKTALITGGTGSFGQAMLRHLLKIGYKQIRIYSRDEEKQHVQRLKFADSRIEFYIGDIRERDRLFSAMRGVDRVFHAAAYKQIPSCEFFPMEAVKTNIVGSENVIEAAISRGIESVVMLSTDKAVYPVNAMGMSKAMMEKLVQARARVSPAGDTRISIVRFGNVAGSRGSVIPRFIEQAIENKPLTVTDPDMTRFLMPLDQTVELVDFAMTQARFGDILVRKAPATTIETLALAVCELFGSTAGMKIIGERHGEKKFETLATVSELHRCEDMGVFLRIPLDTRGLNYETYHEIGDQGELRGEDYNSHNTERLDIEETKKLLLSLDFVKNRLHAVQSSAKA